MTRDSASKPGPKPAVKTLAAGKLTAAGSHASGGLPEPDPMLDDAELAVFQTLLGQIGAHLKKADSAPLNLLARQTCEERMLKRALNAIDPSESPNEFMAARRALTSLQTAISNTMKLLGVGPRARGSSVTLQPLPEGPAKKGRGKASAKAPAVHLPFRNDTDLSDREVAPLADIVWCGVALEQAELERVASEEDLPSLKKLCEIQHQNQTLVRMMGSNAPDDMGTALPADIFDLICRVCGEEGWE